MSKDQAGLRAPSWLKNGLLPASLTRPVTLCATLNWTHALVRMIWNHMVLRRSVLRWIIHWFFQDGFHLAWKKVCSCYFIKIMMRAILHNLFFNLFLRISTRDQKYLHKYLIWKLKGNFYAATCVLMWAGCLLSLKKTFGTFPSEALYIMKELCLLKTCGDWKNIRPLKLKAIALLQKYAWEYFCDFLIGTLHWCMCDVYLNASRLDVTHTFIWIRKQNILYFHKPSLKTDCD